MGWVVDALVLKVFGSWAGLWMALCLRCLAHGVGCVWPRAYGVWHTDWVVDGLVLKVFGSWDGLCMPSCLRCLAHGLGCRWPCA